MPLLEWTEDLSVGVKVLDEDHKILIGIINELYDAMVVGKGEALVENILGRLKEYVAVHFFREESLLKSYNYPGYSAHTDAHNHLKEQLETFYQAYLEQGSGMLHIKLSGFLSSWLLEHIKQQDFQYKPFFKEHGLS